MKNLLRTYRKKTELSIDNISFLLSMQDSSTLSRCERGSRKPSLEIMFTYHVLFQISVEKLFESEMKNTMRKIALNIDPLIESLLEQELTKKVEARVTFLKSLKELINSKL
jgi:DNA-binding XRE family transcriptional regulator